MSAPKEPVVTQDGYLYHKEAILENLLQQKKAIKRKMAAWEAEQQGKKQKVGAGQPTWLVQALSVCRVAQALSFQALFPGARIKVLGLGHKGFRVFAGRWAECGVGWPGCRLMRRLQWRRRQS